MNWTTEQIKQLVEKYPYLAPHNSWTGKLVEDYDYSYTELWSLPEGWHKLFLLLCKELRPHIEKAGLLDTWYFTQLKEKYGTMRVYTCCNPESIDHLIDLYECYSKYVCQYCGNFSKFVTTGWISHLCDDCYNKFGKQGYRIIPKKVVSFICFSKGITYELRYSYRKLKQEYKYVLNMSDSQFLEYILN